MAELMTIGKFIAKLRKEFNYTQKELADLLNVSNKTISSWENDNTLPDIYYIPEIAKIFNISSDELLKCKKNNDNEEVDVKILRKENYNFRKKIYLSVIITLSILLVGMIFMFFYMLETFTLGYDSIENEIINGIVYKKNDDGKYSVIGLTNDNRDKHIVLEDEINGIEVTIIRGGAFRNEMFETITFSSNIHTIESSAFQNCSVQNVELNEGLKKIDLYAFRSSGIKKLDIPSTVTYLGSGAFYNCIDLETVSGGEGLVEIDLYGFYNCCSLTDVNISGYVSIKEGAFSKCVELNKAKFENVIEIEQYAFRYTSIIKVALPKTLRYLNTCAFYDCSFLEEIGYKGTKEEFLEIIFEDEEYGIIFSEKVIFNYIEKDWLE